MQLTSRTEYAVRAMLDLARLNGEQATAKDIAKRQEIPPKFLPQIMVDLSRAGLVQGTRGSGGGVRIAVNPADVTIRRIVDALEGPMSLYACLEDSATCRRRGRCEVQHVWSWAQSRFLDALNDFTLQDLLDGDASRRVHMLPENVLARTDLCPTCHQPTNGHHPHQESEPATV